MFIKYQLVEYGGKVSALEHKDVPDYLGGHKSILHLLIRDEVIQPVLTKFWNATHLEEVW